MTKIAFIPNFFRFYNLMWTLALPFLKTSRRLRTGFDRRVSPGHLPGADIWLQAASAGEAYLAVRLIRGMDPPRSLHVLVTTTTVQGMDILESGLTRPSLSRRVHLSLDWFPFDRPDIAQAAVRAVRPRVMVLLETELWPGLLHSLKQNQARILIINARMSARSHHRYMKTRWLWRRLAPDEILAVSTQDARRFGRVFDAARVRTMNNIKFESMETPNPVSSTLPNKSGRPVSDLLPLTILASVREPEEKRVLKLLKTILTDYPAQCVAVFPRHMNRIPHWEKHLTANGMTFHRRSDLSSPLTGPGIILWDVFGELKTVYAWASVVFVGGTLKPLGGQNFIEPAVAGAVTVIGPYFDDFAWAAKDMLRENLIFQAPDWRQAARIMVRALTTPRDREDLKNRVQAHVRSRQGGSRRACREILKSFDLKPQPLYSQTDPTPIRRQQT